MSNQESVFAGQEQQYPDPRMINNDPRERQQWQMGGEKLRPQQPPLQPRRRSLLAVVAVIVIVLLALWYLSHALFAAIPSNPSNSTTKSFSVFGAPTLVITDPSGRVHIHRGEDARQVTVNWSIRHFGFGDNTKDIQLVAVQNGDTISITVPETSAFPLSGIGEANLDISVPQKTNVRLNDQSGTVDIEDINGQINAATGSGDIQARDVAGQITLHTDSGSINTESINGIVGLSTNSGNIEMRNASLQGPSTLNVDSGSIQFDGTLDPHGTYDFETASGSIDVALPQNSAFHLDTGTNSGVLSNEFGNNDVGSNPRAHLTLKTGSGSIDIHKRAI
ncbi:MAG: DUF4097 family beta strand repeat protein [Chloroflexi bacterium]|nr:DUF4097 family beta strand repeat protein [Chloroflexota bacterium]